MASWPFTASRVFLGQEIAEALLGTQPDPVGRALLRSPIPSAGHPRAAALRRVLLVLWRGQRKGDVLVGTEKLC